MFNFCIPNIDGCTSISQVGRYPPINYFFKTFMFISIFIIFIYIFFTVISELLLSISYKKNSYLFKNDKIINFKYYFNLVLSTFGLILLPLVIYKIIDYPNFKNIVSWNYFILIQINFLITFFCWKKV